MVHKNVVIILQSVCLSECSVVHLKLIQLVNCISVKLGTKVTLGGDSLKYWEKQQLQILHRFFFRFSRYIFNAVLTWPEKNALWWGQGIPAVLCAVGLIKPVISLMWNSYLLEILKSILLSSWIQTSVWFEKFFLTLYSCVILVTHHQ